MDKETFEEEKKIFEEWFWEIGKEALLIVESPSALMLIAWIARAEKAKLKR